MSTWQQWPREWSGRRLAKPHTAECAALRPRSRCVLDGNTHRRLCTGARMKAHRTCRRRRRTRVTPADPSHLRTVPLAHSPTRALPLAPHALLLRSLEQAEFLAAEWRVPRVPRVPLRGPTVGTFGVLRAALAALEWFSRTEEQRYRTTECRAPEGRAVHALDRSATKRRGWRQQRAAEFHAAQCSPAPMYPRAARSVGVTFSAACRQKCTASRFTPAGQADACACARVWQA